MKKSITIMLVFIICAAIVFTGCQDSSKEGESEEKTLVVAMELAYPPFETKDAEGNPYGVSVDLAKAFGEYTGKEIVIDNVAWDGLIPSLETGKADMILSSMTVTEERKKAVDFTNPYAEAHLALLTNKESNINSPEDLNGKDKTIAVKTGSTGAIFAEKNFPESNIVKLADESACVTEVTQGKADAFIYDQLTIYRNEKDNQETTKAVPLPDQQVEYWAVAVKKGNEELVTEWNEFLAQYEADGGFQQLTDKHLKEEKQKFDELGFQWFFKDGSGQ